MQVVKSQSFPSSLPHLTFLGKLLHSNPSLSINIAQSQGEEVKIVLSGTKVGMEALLYGITEHHFLNFYNTLTLSLIHPPYGGVTDRG